MSLTLEASVSPPKSVTPSTGLAVLSALVPLSAPPLALALFGALGTEDQSFTDRVEMGGAAMYVVAMIGVVAALVGATGAFLASRGRFAVSAAGTCLALIAWGLGAVSFEVGAEAVLGAAVHADPGDRAFVLRGSIGELNQLLVLVAALSAALFATQGVALIVGHFAAKESVLRRVLLALGLGLVALGAWQSCSARELSAESAAMSASAHAPPSERLALVAEGFEAMASSRQLGHLPLFLAVTLAVGGALVLRRDRRKAATVLFGILVPTVVLVGARAAAQMDPLAQELMAVPAIDGELLVLEAPPIVTTRTRILFLRNELVDAAGQAPRFEYLEGTELGLALEDGVTGEGLMAALSQLKAASVRSVTLIGKVQTPVPSSVPSIHAHLFDEARGLTVGLARPSDCRGTCTPATLDERGVSWGGKTWPLKKSSAWQSAVQTLIPVSTDGLTLESLLWACHSVAGEGGQIVLLIPE